MRACLLRACVLSVFLQQCVLRRLAPSLGLAPPCRLGLEPLQGVVPLARLGVVQRLGLAPRLGLGLGVTLGLVHLPHIAIAAPRILLLEVFASHLADLLPHGRRRSSRRSSHPL